MKISPRNAKRVTQSVIRIFLLIMVCYVTRYTLRVTPVFADSGQYGQYGQYGQPAPVQTILVNKMVAKPGSVTKGGTLNYVNNLSPSDPRFKPGDQVMFQIQVKNTSAVTLNDVTVKDIVPVYIEPVEGPGIYDPSPRAISWNAGSFAPNEQKTYYLKMQLVAQNQMPSDKGLFCLTNQAQATNGTVTDRSTSQFCVEKQVMAVTVTPQAGPEAGLLILGANVILAGIGFSLKKLARINNKSASS